MELCFLTNVSSQEWAAWVQAIGALLAIGVAIYVSSSQASAARTLQREIARNEHRRQLEHAAALLAGCNEVVERSLLAIEVALRSATSVKVQATSVQAALDALKLSVAIPMPGAAVQSLMTARGTLAELLVLIEGVNGWVTTGNSGVTEMVSRIREVMRRSMGEVDTALAAAD